MIMAGRTSGRNRDNMRWDQQINNPEEKKQSAFYVLLVRDCTDRKHQVF